MRLKPEEVRIINAVRGLTQGQVRVFKAEGRVTEIHASHRQVLAAPTITASNPPAPGQILKPTREAT